MTLRLNGSTSGYVEIDAPAVAGSTAITIPATTGGEFIVSDSSGNIDLGPLDINGGASDDSVVIDGSGRLLVGTTASTQAVRAVFQGNSNAAGGTGVFVLGFGGASPSGGASLGNIDFTDSSHTAAARIQGIRDGGTWTSGVSQPTRLVFSTTPSGSASPVERMRISQAGTVTIGNSQYLHPETDNAVSLGLSGYRWSSVWAANGTIQTSDQRTKTDIADAQIGADFIKALRPVSYKWIDGGKRDTGGRDEDGNYIYESVPGIRTHWGFIAQEVKQAVDAAGVDFGGWVLTDKDDPDSQQALRYDQFIAPLTKALQEALTRIETLETANASLEARLTALEGGNS
jgi:hypothetical protein